MEQKEEPDPMPVMVARCTNGQRVLYLPTKSDIGIRQNSPDRQNADKVAVWAVALGTLWKRFLCNMTPSDWLQGRWPQVLQLVTSA